MCVCCTKKDLNLHNEIQTPPTAILKPYALHKKMKFPIKDFFSKCDQICSFLGIWSHLLKKPLMENFIFGVVNIGLKQVKQSSLNI